MPIQLGGSELAPGERREYWAALGNRPDASPLGVPLIAMRGTEPGPVLGVVAGIHGDEFEGPDAVRLLLSELDSRELNGGIICTPQANISAMENLNRMGGVDFLDLNRSFPGDATGFLTQRVAAVLVKEIVEQANFLIDLHGGGLAYDLEPYAGFSANLDDTGRASFALAKAFGLELLYGSTPFPNVLRLEAAKRNIPAILVEAGGEGRLNPGRVNLMKRGLVNALRYLGMLKGEPEGVPEEYTIIQAPPGGEFRHLPTGGLLRSVARVGRRVRKGELLATIVDVFGKELARIDAHEDGIIIEARTLPVARTGDWGYAIARVVGKAQYDTPLEIALRGSE